MTTTTGPVAAKDSVLTLKVVDVAAAYREIFGDIPVAVGREPLEHDHRFEIVTAMGARITFGRPATAEDVAAYLLANDLTQGDGGQATMGTDPTAPLDLDDVRAALADVDLGDGAAGAHLAEVLLAEVERLRALPAVVEHGQLMSVGGFHVRNDAPEIERIYPLAEWIVNSSRFGGKVFRRSVLVVEDWTEVTEPSTEETR